MIGIIKYSSGGNINAYKNIFDNEKIEYIEANNYKELKNCKKIILPGVGAFDESISSLKKEGFYDYIKNELIFDNSKSLLGVCVGFQILCNSSEEGNLEGMSLFDADVKKFNYDNVNFIPHMGWNGIYSENKNHLLNNIDKGIGFYFLHSFYVPNSLDCSIAYSKYGIDICCLNRNNIYGVQFHPEKSHSNGIMLIKNFLEL